MIELRKSNERGRTKIEWLDSLHSFSFGSYYDPRNINFGPLRVINEDTVQPSGGFPTHSHNDMEIITIIMEGAIAHKDSSGGDGIITENEVQRMTAGSGILHSEFNPSKTEELKFFQIWILPRTKGLEPSYEQKKLSPEERHNRLLKIVSGEKEDNTIFINQDAKIFLSDLDFGRNINYDIKKDRGIYLQLMEGGGRGKWLFVKRGRLFKNYPGERNKYLGTRKFKNIAL